MGFAGKAVPAGTVFFYSPLSLEINAINLSGKATAKNLCQVAAATLRRSFRVQASPSNSPCATWIAADMDRWIFCKYPCVNRCF